MNANAELVPVQQAPLAVQPEQDIDVTRQIAVAVAQGKIDPQQLGAVLDFLERVDKRRAEAAYNVAMQQAQEEIKPVVRDAENSHTRSRYARLEKIDNAIRPIYTKHGFSLSFNTGEPRNKDAVRVLCDVRHVAGHTKTHELEGDLDVSGSQGKSNKTSIQGLGSSVSYLRRYLTLMIFNVTLTNEDNDGNGAITDAQANTLRDMMAACEMSQTAQAAFMKLIGVPSIEELPARRYEDILESLRAKLQQKQRAGR